LSDAAPVTLTPEPGIPEIDWALAFRVLEELLRSNDGCISSMALRAELEEKHSVPNAREEVVVALKRRIPVGLAPV
jgi:hypothetical protein